MKKIYLIILFLIIISCNNERKNQINVENDEINLNNQMENISIEKYENIIRLIHWSYL